MPDEIRSLPLTRRQVITALASAAALVPAPLAAANPSHGRYTLTARGGRARLRGTNRRPTAIWGFDGITPGPLLRVRQGETLDVAFRNRLDEPLTIHWHGLRLPNAMDGVPGLTQPPVLRGESFRYRFEVPDAGTYFYHPHGRTARQLGRGLYGALIVDEKEPIPVDRDLVWILSDWKLLGDGRIDPKFEDPQAQSHEGRIGDTVTLNGAPPGNFPVRPGERLRVRLINAANARIFHCAFSGIDPWLIAGDGHPVAPRRMNGAPVVLGPGMRLDCIVDAPVDALPFAMLDSHPAKDPVPLIRFLAQGDPLARDRSPPPALAGNPVPEPSLDSAERHEIVLGGGAAPGHHGTQATPHAAGTAMWTLNGKSLLKHGGSHAGEEPLLRLRRGTSIVLTFRNETVFDHPMHLHGFAFRVLTRNGKPEPGRPLSDTVLLAANENVEIAFHADNPGNWMLHCHILEHADAGMGAVVSVT
jgi:FtsP/CotA-like multicopper oxidase with cupredoxin domain